MVRIQFPHLALGEPRTRYDIDDPLAQRWGVSVVAVSCGGEKTTTITTRRLDLVRCQRCLSARWHRQPVVEAGDVGGDVQASEAWSVRWVRLLSDGRFASVTRAYYAAYEDPNAVGPVHLQCQTVYAVSRSLDDLGGSEEWSEITYTTVPGPATLGSPYRELAEKAPEPTAGEWRRAGGHPPLYAWPNPGTSGYQALMGEFRMGDFADPYGHASGFAHGLAGVAYVRYKEILPEWTPGAYSERSAREEYPDSMILEIIDCEHANLNDIRAVYTVVCRYLDWAKLAGRGY